MPAHQWWQLPHYYKGNNISSMIMLAWLRQRHHCNEGNNCHCDNGKDACTSIAMMPLEQGQKCHCNDGKGACASMLTTTPLQQGWQHQLEDGNDPSQEVQQPCCRSRATMPLLQGQQCYLDDGKDACPLTSATTPSSWGLQLQLQQLWRCLCIDGSKAIATRAMTPLQWRQGRLCITHDNNAIATRAMMPA